MEMTPQEIVGSYRRATNKSEQIKILSELNACSKEDITKILKDQGVTVKTPGRKKKSAVRKAAVAPVQQDECTEAAVPEEKDPANNETEQDTKAAGCIPEIVLQAIHREKVLIQEQIDAAKNMIVKQMELVRAADETIKKKEQELQELTEYEKRGREAV